MKRGFLDRIALPALAALAALAVSAAPAALGCGNGVTAATGTGGAGTASASASATGTGGGAGTGGGGADVTKSVYPDLASLQALGVARTCSLNQGVCHSQKDYPELGAAADLLATIGAPCQLGVQDPASTLDQCEIPGDALALGGQDYEILQVTIAPDAPFPLAQVDLELAAAPPALDAATAHIHRPAGSGAAVSKPLTGTTLAPGADATHVVVTLAGATDPSLATFLDVRAWHGDRVRQGDPNANGKAHSAKDPWAEVFPGDPARSFLYQRLVAGTYGPSMPLLPRTWTPAATRAVWCWIHGLPKDATPASVKPTDAIDYAHCPVDPNAPDPNAPGGWPAVKLLFESKCATGPCHSAATHSGLLDLTPTAASLAKSLLDVPSSQQPGVLRVVPGQPAASYLLCKVSPTCASRAPNTGSMPLNGTPLSDLEIKTVSDWILNGAPTQ